MLYDQAQLVVSYITAYQITKDEFYADVAREILSYVSRDLSDKSGGFYSAEDADSLPTADAVKKREGAFCVWSRDELESLLSGSVTAASGAEVKVVDVVCFHYDIQTDGNVSVHKDPHGELTKQNVLIERGDVTKTAAKFNLTVDQVQTELRAARQRMWQQRLLRPRPHLDNKMITAWNGMVITAFAKAGQALADESYLTRALEAMQFVRRELYQTDTSEASSGGRLLRSCYVDSSSADIVHSKPVIHGFVDDYAFMVRACLDVYESVHDECWLEWAVTLQDAQDALFWDQQDSAYFTTTPDDPSVILRLKDDQDGAEPSSNSVSAHNLLRLAAIMDSAFYRQRAEAMFAAFASHLENIPVAVPEMLRALMLYSLPVQQIVVCGSPSSADTKALLRCVHCRHLPRHVLIVVDPDKRDGFLRSRRESVGSFTQVDGRATAHVCDNFTCGLPVIDAAALDEILCDVAVN